MNNETGVIQPSPRSRTSSKATRRSSHVDGAQAFGKVFEPLAISRVDLVSISGHKISAPKGDWGPLITRRRGYRRPRSNQSCSEEGRNAASTRTLPVALIAGLGMASAISRSEHLDASDKTSGHPGGALGSLDADRH